MGIHSGSCHCGNVKFEIDADISELTTCDCSLCVKKNAVMTKVHKDSFVLVSGEQSLNEYKWNTQVARHFFCNECGIYTFHRKRALPDHYGVNVHCLDGLDLSSVRVTQTKGASMSVVDDKPRAEWPGPRVS